MGGKMIINGFIKPFSDNEQLSEVENGKIPLPARWQFGVFGGPKKAYAGFPRLGVEFHPEKTEALKGILTFLSP